jgi:hypothetical protein
MQTAQGLTAERKDVNRPNAAAHPLAIWIALLAGGVVVAAVLMREQDARGLVALAFLTPVMSFSIAVGGLLIPHVWALMALVSGSVVLASVVLYLRARRELSAIDKSLLLFVSLAILAEAALLDGRIFIGAALLTTAAIAALRRPAGVPLESDAFEWRDVAILGIVTAAAALLRLYALNRIPDVFEGELSPYYLAATRLAGIPLGNAGAGGPWAPLGYLFFIPIFGAIKLFGSTVLAIRFSSAAVGLCTLSLLYVFTLKAYGRPAAALAATFYALDPLQIGWGRTDVHPHGVTAWPAVLIALVCLRAFPAGGLRWFALLAPLMALTWHQYPSGQTAVFIPVIVLGIALIRRERVRRLGAKVGLLAAGLAGWLAGPMLTRVGGANAGGLSEYFAQLGPRVAWPGGASAGFFAAVERLSRHVATLAGDVIVGLFVELRYTFHQDIFVPVPELPSRSISWIVAALVLAGMCLMIARRLLTTADRIVTAWIVVALLPAIFSDHAYPKRSAMLFPALFVVAAAAGGRFLSTIREHDAWVRRAVRPLAAVAVALWFCATTWLWFSGVRWPEGTPNESLLVERLRPELRPGTIVIAKVWHGYAPGKLTYLLSDALRDSARAPLLWYVMTPDRDLQSLIENPTLAAAYASSDAFYYRWPGVGPVTVDSSSTPFWSRVVYVLQTGIDSADRLRLRGVGQHDRLDQEWLDVLEASCGLPRFTIAPRDDCDDCGFVVVACPVHP